MSLISHSAPPPPFSSTNTYFNQFRCSAIEKCSCSGETETWNGNQNPEQEENIAFLIFNNFLHSSSQVYLGRHGLWVSEDGRFPGDYVQVHFPLSHFIPLRLVFANFLSWETVCWEKFGLLLGNIWLLFQIINISFSSAAGKPYPEHTYYLLCPVIALTCALMYTPSANSAPPVEAKLKINCNHCLLITTYFESSSI